MYLGGYLTQIFFTTVGGVPRKNYGDLLKWLLKRQTNKSQL